jgi:hypothetical protein
LEYGYIGPQPKHFYRHRQDPVPWTGHGRHRSVFRFPKTRNERKAYYGWKTTQDCLQALGLNAPYRAARKPFKLRDHYDDIQFRHQRSWKKHRKTQWK